jgi:hypothetical protein
VEAADVQPSHITQNIFSVDGTTDCIWLGANSYTCTVNGNTFFASGNTARGVHAINHGSLMLSIFNNYFEGFDEAIDLDGDRILGFVGNNGFFNNTSDTVNYPGADEAAFDLSANDEAMAATGLAKSGADTYANRLVYFAPAAQEGMQDEGWHEFGKDTATN